MVYPRGSSKCWEYATKLALNFPSYSRKYKLGLSEQNIKPLNSVPFKEHFLNRY